MNIESEDNSDYRLSLDDILKQFTGNKYCTRHKKSSKIVWGPMFNNGNIVLIYECCSLMESIFDRETRYEFKKDYGFGRYYSWKYNSNS